MNYLHREANLEPSITVIKHTEAALSHHVSRSALSRPNIDDLLFSGRVTARAPFSAAPRARARARPQPPVPLSPQRGRSLCSYPSLPPPPPFHKPPPTTQA